MLVVKVHKSYRVVVALCDADLIGKCLEEDIRELNIRASFFQEKEITHQKAVHMLKAHARDDATFNIVGPKAIKAAIDAEIISSEGIATIQGIPFALVLV